MAGQIHADLSPRTLTRVVFNSLHFFPATQTELNIGQHLQPNSPKLLSVFSEWHKTLVFAKIISQLVIQAIKAFRTDIQFSAVSVRSAGVTSYTTSTYYTCMPAFLEISCLENFSLFWLLHYRINRSAIYPPKRE